MHQKRLGLGFNTRPHKPTIGALTIRLLGGSGVVISGAISPLIWVISTATLLITLLITTVPMNL